MHSLLSAFALLFFFQRDPVRPMDELRLKQAAEIERFDRERQTVILLQRREFEKRFNDLSQAMEEFSKEYEAGKGEVWPRKRAEALAKAIRRLEDTHLWKTGIERQRRDAR